MKLRRVQPMVLPEITAAVVAEGDRPKLVWTAPTNLYVDATYQRDLSRKSIRVIKQIVQNFAWNRMKPPVVVDDGGRFHVIDGQHTAIAAATIGIAELPVFVVSAIAVDERARAFVGHNTDRITVTPINIYKALLAAGDPDAQDVERVCERAGVRIREMNQSMVAAEGDTKSIGLISAMIKKHGVVKSRKVLECLVKGKLRPIPGAAILAAQAIICVEQPGIDLERLTAAIRVEGIEGISKAKAKALEKRSQFWRELRDRWIRRCAQ